MSSGVLSAAGAKSAVSSAARNVNRLLHALGTGSEKADFYGHPFGHPLADAYHSQAALRWGAHVAKIGAFPASSEQEALAAWRLDPDTDPNGFRRAATDFFAGNDAVFELRAQLRTCAETQPVEDASVRWPEDEAPFRTVGTIRLAAQDASGPARRAYFDEKMSP